MYIIFMLFIVSSLSIVYGIMNERPCSLILGIILFLFFGESSDFSPVSLLVIFFTVLASGFIAKEMEKRRKKRKEEEEESEPVTLTLTISEDELEKVKKFFNEGKKEI